jgi:hypothetical protein
MVLVISMMRLSITIITIARIIIHLIVGPLGYENSVFITFIFIRIIVTKMIREKGRGEGGGERGDMGKLGPRLSYFLKHENIPTAVVADEIQSV